MKRTLTAALILFCVTASAQRIAVHKGAEYSDSLNAVSATLPTPSVHLDNAGKYLDTSAMCEVLSWGLAAVSIGVISNANTETIDKRKNIALVCAGAALAAKVFAVSYKTKAGNELRLAAGALSVTF